eukprot:jgi/Ulvmu1/5083/UM021_0100.1
MQLSGRRFSVFKEHPVGLRPTFAAPKVSAPRDAKTHGVVPVGERNGWWLKHPQPNLLDASGLEDLVAVLQQHPDNLVLVEFFAPWCASCKALYPKLSKLCEANPQIIVVKLNFEESKELAKKFGVKVLPFFHAYHGSLGRVAAFSSSVTKIQRLKDCIEIFGMPYCDLQTRDSKVDLSKSLPEFENLPTPDDATILKFSPDGQYDANASMDEAAAVPAVASAKAAA